MPLTKQVLAVSATYPEVLANLVSRYMKKPSFVRLGHQQPTLLGVKQFVFRVAFHPMAQQQAKNKFEVLLKMLKVVQFGQCMIFTNVQTRCQDDVVCSITCQLISIFFFTFHSQSRKPGSPVIKLWPCSFIDFGKSNSDKTIADAPKATPIPMQNSSCHRFGI